MRAYPDFEISRLKSFGLPANRDHAYVERRMLRGEYARAVGRDLWFWLRIVIREARGKSDDDRAAQLARQLCYLCQNYDAETATDRYQGME